MYLIENLFRGFMQVIRRRKIKIIVNQKVLSSLLLHLVAITLPLGVFGLISSIMLITANHTVHNFVIFAFIIQYLPDFKNNNNNSSNDNHKVIMVGSLYLRSQYWLYKYAFNKDFDLLSVTDPPVSDTHFII